MSLRNLHTIQLTLAPKYAAVQCARSERDENVHVSSNSALWWSHTVSLVKIHFQLLFDSLFC